MWENYTAVSKTNQVLFYLNTMIFISGKQLTDVDVANDL